MMIGVKGKQLCAGNPNAGGGGTDGQTDGRTDGHGDSVYPPNFVAGGIIIIMCTLIYSVEVLRNSTVDISAINVMAHTVRILILAQPNFSGNR